MKNKRQETILTLVSQRELETQEQILESLKEQGIITTQATVSRDIKQLHLVKERTQSGFYKYAVSRRRSGALAPEKLKTIFKEGVISFDMAQNLVVVKTMPGFANAAAAAIDKMDIPDLVGSLAGDDTVLLILRTDDTARNFCQEIRGLLS